MKRRTLSAVLSFVLAFVFGLSLMACGSSGKVNEITLDKTQLSLFVGEEYTLTATTDPKGASLTWKSDDPSVATVTDGKVKGIKSGNTAVWVESKNGIKAVCNVTVKEVWQGALENTFAQTDYTVEITEDLGMSAESAGTYVEMYGLDINHVVKYNKASDLFSAKVDTSMTQNEESLGSITTMTYGQLEGDSAYAYRANGYGTAEAEWREYKLFTESTDPDYSFTETVSYVAFELLRDSYQNADGEIKTLYELTDNATYDASANKLTVTGVVGNFTFMDPEGGYITKEFDVEIEVILENNLVKSFKIDLSRIYGYDEIFGGNDYSRDGEPENLLLVGEITATVEYGNTQVAIAAADESPINALKANRPLKDAFNAINERELNFTLTVQAGGQNVATAKYMFTEEGGIYSFESVILDPEYASIVTDDEGDSYTTKYYMDNGIWYKSTEKVRYLSGDAANVSIDKTFFVGDKEDPEEGYKSSLSYLYSKLTKGGDNTYSATLVDCYYEWDSELGRRVYTFADCLVTVKLDSQGRLSYVNYNYGSKADGVHFINLKYNYSNYGTTQATIPQNVLDGAKEIIPRDDSEIYQAFEKLDNNTDSATIIYQQTDNVNTEYNSTQTIKIDVENGKMETVYSEYDSRYSKLTEEGGTCYRYSYDYSNGIWFYNKYEVGTDYEYALKDFARINCSGYSYSVSDGGDSTGLQYLYWLFEKSGNEYTAEMYYITYKESKVYIPCEVTLRLDDEGRLTSIKVEMYNGKQIIAVDEYTVSYDPVTVTFPDEVENAKEWISQEESEIYQAFDKLNNNTDSVIVNYTFTDHNNSEENYTETQTIDTVNQTKKNEGESTSYQRLVSDNGSYYVYYYYYTDENWYCSASDWGDSEYAILDFMHIQLSNIYSYCATQEGSGTYPGNLYFLFNQSGNEYTAHLYYAEWNYNQDTEESEYVYTPCTITVQIDGEGRITSLNIDIDDGADAHMTHQYTFSYDGVSVTIPDDALAVQPQE